MSVLVKSLGRRLKGRIGGIFRRLRNARSADSGELRAFWRNHGRDWATDEASPEDRARIVALAEKLAPMSASQQELEVVTALKAIWRDGFLDPTDAFGWDDMNDGLPASSLVPFVLGAADAGERAREKN